MQPPGSPWAVATTAGCCPALLQAVQLWLVLVPGCSDAPVGGARTHTHTHTHTAATAFGGDRTVLGYLTGLGEWLPHSTVSPPHFSPKPEPALNCLQKGSVCFWPLIFFHNSLETCTGRVPYWDSSNPTQGPGELRPACLSTKQTLCVHGWTQAGTGTGTGTSSTWTAPGEPQGPRPVGVTMHLSSTQARCPAGWLWFVIAKPELLTESQPESG